YMFFFSSRRRHTRSKRDWSSDVCSSDLSQGLINSTPAIEQVEKLEPIRGHVPSPSKKPSGCPFHPRCPFAMDKCKESNPPSLYYEKNEMVKCWLYEKEDTQNGQAEREQRAPHPQG